MSMGFMVAAAASRKRDDRGRYMEGNQGNRMDGGYDRPEGNYPRMGDEPEMRRRRDSRGRYMEGGGGSRMEYDGNRGNYGRMEQGGGNTSHYWPWPEPHIPPYLDQPDMREERNIRPGRERRRSEYEGGAEMRMMPERDYPPMRDRNIVNIRDYQDRRRIGFGANRMEDDDDEGEEDMRQYGRRYNPDRMSMGRSSQQSHQMGRSESEGDSEHLTREEAEKWVKGMKSEDGKVGGRWPYQEIRQYAGNFGIQGEEKIVEFFAVMNALETDYGKVAKKYGVDKVDFWADLAKAFIHDKDANPGKVKMYYECIAKKDED